MSTTVTVNGTNYTCPAEGETAWGTRLKSLLAALGARRNGIIMFHAASSTGASADRFAAPFLSSHVAGTAEVFWKAPCAGAIRGMSVRCTTGPQVAPVTLTARINGSPIAMTVEVPVGATKVPATSADGTEGGSEVVASGDTISVSLWQILGNTGPVNLAIAIQFKADN